MALALQPRIAYSQPDALCRTLVFRWGGLLLGSGANESRIVGGLVSALDRRQRTSEYVQTRQDHRDPTRTKAYQGRGGFSGVSTVTWNRKDVNYFGYTVIQEREFKRELEQGTSLIVRQDADDRAGAVRQALSSANQANAGVRQLAFALSLHYHYPKNNSESGHTVGVFISRGGTGARQAGTRFFDPNNGSWRFADLESLFRFYETDWLPNFIANSMKGDPGHDSKGRRELTFFRLVGLLPA